MKRLLVSAIGVLALAGLALAAGPKTAAAPGPEWNMNATVIEACSCTMFCQCYFNSTPSGHHEHEGEGMKHFCKANNAYKINHGQYGTVKLDGAKFWLTVDLGADFSKGKMKWAIATFDKATTKEQRDGILAILPHLFPVKWESFKTGEGDITWNSTGGEAHALLDGGKTAEVHLKATVTSNTPGDPVVIKNLKYWGATNNDGFVLMPAVLEAFRVTDKAFEFKGTNGFMLTLDIDSKTAPPAASGE